MQVMMLTCSFSTRMTTMTQTRSSTWRSRSPVVLRSPSASSTHSWVLYVPLHLTHCTACLLSSFRLHIVVHYEQPPGLLSMPAFSWPRLRPGLKRSRPRLWKLRRPTEDAQDQNSVLGNCSIAGKAGSWLDRCDRDKLACTIRGSA